MSSDHLDLRPCKRAYQDNKPIKVCFTHAPSVLEWRAEKCWEAQQIAAKVNA